MPRSSGTAPEGVAVWPSFRVRRSVETRERVLRGVAQSGSASALGAEGRVFESRRPDQVSLPADGSPIGEGGLSASTNG